MSDSEGPEQANDLDPGTWDSLPADSETEVDFPEFRHRVTLPPEIVVSMVVTFPDGVTWEHVERVESENLDQHAQAAAMIEEVSETMKVRIGRVLD